MIFFTEIKFSSPDSTETFGFVVSDLYFNSAVRVTTVLTVANPTPSYFFLNSLVSLYFIGG